MDQFSVPYCQQAQNVIVLTRHSANTSIFSLLLFFLLAIMAAEPKVKTDIFGKKGEKRHCSQAFALSNHPPRESSVPIKSLHMRRLCIWYPIMISVYICSNVHITNLKKKKRLLQHKGWSSLIDSCCHVKGSNNENPTLSYA